MECNWHGDCRQSGRTKPGASFRGEEWEPMQPSDETSIRSLTVDTQSTIVERLRYNAIDDAMSRTLREAKDFLLAEMPPVLDAFYDHVARYPETMAFFRNREQMMHAKAMQIRHWSIIAEGRFDQNYEASVTRIGETHNRLGLEPRWYIGGYNFLISGMFAAIAKRYGGKRDGDRRTALQTAFVKAALLDMDLAIAVYLDSGQRERVAAMAENFEKGVGQVYSRISTAANELKSTAKALSASAQESSGQTAIVAAAAEQTAANVQTVAAAAEELSASAREIGSEAERSTSVVAEAFNRAQQASEGVNRLSDFVRKIGDVVDLISKIAKQTNLLALNATIEAARAGDAGRGFAVVAQEVKLLAEQTAKATSEIGGQIREVQELTGNAVSSITSISDIVRTINDSTAIIAHSVEQQGVATLEIAKNANEAATGTTSVSSTILAVSDASRETDRASGLVLSFSDAMSDEAEQLRTAVESFLHAIRDGDKSGMRQAA